MTATTRAGAANGPARVLVTGAAGHIGRLLVEAWRDRYQLTLTDRRHVEAPPGARVVQGDIATLAFARTACRDIDVVVHLAGLPSPLTPWRELRRPNVKGTWATLKAARDAGCHRVVFASSIMIDARPELDYSRGKRVCERLGQRYAADAALSVISLRVGHVMTVGDHGLWPGTFRLRYSVIDADVVQGFTLAVDAPAHLHSETLPLLSANRDPIVDTADTDRRLGFHPQFDVSVEADRVYRSPRGWLKRLKHRMMGRS